MCKRKSTGLEREEAFRELMAEEGATLLEAFDIEDIALHLKNHGYIVDDTPIQQGYRKIIDYIDEQIKVLPVPARIDLFDKIKKHLDDMEDLLCRYY